MIINLANFLNNPPQHVGMQVIIAVLGVSIVIVGMIVGLISLGHTVKSDLGKVVALGMIMIGISGVLCSSDITYRFEKQNLQTELNSKMEIINNEYPYSLSIASKNDNVYFVFCKTKNDQNEVIKTMNTGNNPAIRFSNKGATYMNLPQQIHNGIQFEKGVEEKDLLLIVKNNFEEF